MTEPAAPSTRPLASDDSSCMDVTLTVPASHDQLALIRMVTEMTSMQCGCTLDQSADLKLAVDLVCTLLIDAAEPTSRVDCRYCPTDAELRVEIRAVTAAAWQPEADSIEWRILHSLTNDMVLTDSGHATESFVALTVGKPV